MRSAWSIGTIALVAIGVGWTCVGELRAGPGPDAAAVLEPGPELAGADARGAADVERAQKLARKKLFAEAVAILEPVAAALPSAQHDCNLALAYLRAGELTRAQLRWDLARLRGTAPPAWCTTVLAADLAAALRDRGYVPLAMSIAPADAIVDVAGLRVRKLDLLWVAPGTYALTARADGMVDGTAHVAVAAPSARVAIVLAPPVVEVVAPPIDAGVPIDAAVAIDAAPIAIVVPPPAPPRRVRWPAYLGAGVGGAGLVAGILLHARASASRDEANQLVAGAADFEAARDDFGRERTLAITGYAVAAVGLGFAGWWWLGRGDGDGARRPAVGLAIGGDGAAVTVGWPWGTP